MFFPLTSRPYPKGWKQWSCRQRQGYCFGTVCFCMVTEFNPSEPTEHMAKQLLPISGLQQLPLALPSTAPAGRDATGKSLCTHTFLFLWTACGFAGSLCCRLLKEHPSLVYLRNSLVLLWVVCLKLKEKYRCFIYYSQFFSGWWKGFISRWTCMLTENLFFTVFRIRLSNLHVLDALLAL